MKFIFFLLLFYFGFRFLSRLLYLYLVGKARSRKENFNSAKKTDKQKEGEVSIDKMPKNNTKKTNKLGDYVDYEEID